METETKKVTGFWADVNMKTMKPGFHVNNYDPDYMMISQSDMKESIAKCVEMLRAVDFLEKKFYEVAAAGMNSFNITKGDITYTIEHADIKRLRTELYNILEKSVHKSIKLLVDVIKWRPARAAKFTYLNLYRQELVDFVKSWTINGARMDTVPELSTLSFFTTPNTYELPTFFMSLFGIYLHYHPEMYAEGSKQYFKLNQTFTDFFNRYGALANVQNKSNKKVQGELNEFNMNKQLKTASGQLNSPRAQAQAAIAKPTTAAFNPNKAHRMHITASLTNEFKAGTLAVPKTQEFKEKATKVKNDITKIIQDSRSEAINQVYLVAKSYLDANPKKNYTTSDTPVENVDRKMHVIYPGSSTADTYFKKAYKLASDNDKNNLLNIYYSANYYENIQAVSTYLQQVINAELNPEYKNFMTIYAIALIDNMNVKNYSNTLTIGDKLAEKPKVAKKTKKSKK